MLTVSEVGSEVTFIQGVYRLLAFIWPRHFHQNRYNAIIWPKHFWPDRLILQFVISGPDICLWTKVSGSNKRLLSGHTLLVRISYKVTLTPKFTYQSGGCSFRLWPLENILSVRPHVRTISYSSFLTLNAYRRTFFFLQQRVTYFFDWIVIQEWTYHIL